MSITCPRCGAEYDVTLFAFGRTVECTCGCTVDARAPQVRPASPPTARRRPQRPEARELRRRADGITWTLLYSDLPRIDVDIQIGNLRDWVREHLPDRLTLFEMIYEARWARLRAQGWERSRPDV